MSELGTSLAVQWLRLHISAGVSSSILGQQSISHMLLQLRRPSQINIKKKNNKRLSELGQGRETFLWMTAQCRILELEGSEGILVR